MFLLLYGCSLVFSPPQPYWITTPTLQLLEEVLALRSPQRQMDESQRSGCGREPTVTFLGQSSPTPLAICTIVNSILIFSAHPL